MKIKNYSVPWKTWDNTFAIRGNYTLEAARAELKELKKQGFEATDIIHCPAITDAANRIALALDYLRNGCEGDNLKAAAIKQLEGVLRNITEESS